jgi:hypothetical protein
MHDRGLGVPETPNEAVYYYRLAAVEGDVEATEAMADCYMLGRGVPRDLERAAAWLERLAARKDIRSMIRLGDVAIELNRDGAPLRYWTAMIESRDPVLVGYAHERISRIHGEGIGVKPNKRKAAEHFKKALAARNPDALCREAKRLLAEKNAAKALPLLHEAIENASPEGTFLLGTLHLSGTGVPQDPAKGLQLLSSAASRHHRAAQVQLARATLGGVPGAPSWEKALELAEAAEAAGDVEAASVRESLEAARPADAPETDSTRIRSG